MRAAVMKLSRTVDGGGVIVDGWEDRSEMGEPVTCNLEPATCNLSPAANYLSNKYLFNNRLPS